MHANEWQIIMVGSRKQEETRYGPPIRERARRKPNTECNYDVAMY